MLFILSDCVWQTSKVEYTLETKTELRFEVEQGAFVQLEVRHAGGQNRVRSYDGCISIFLSVDAGVELPTSPLVRTLVKIRAD